MFLCCHVVGDWCLMLVFGYVVIGDVSMVCVFVLPFLLTIGV